MSNYQNKILNALKNGAKLQCTEGKNYKTWLIHPNGEKENIRRDSANKICSNYENNLTFGDWDGIKWRK